MAAIVDKEDARGVFPDGEAINSFGEKRELAEIFRHGSSSWVGDPDSSNEIKASLVVFYPFSFSPVCGGELSALNENKGRFAEARVQIIGVSCDSIYTLRAFKDDKGYDFELLSDFWPHGRLSRKLKIFDEEKGISERYTFLVNKEARILSTISSELSAPRKVEQYFASLKMIV